MAKTRKKLTDEEKKNRRRENKKLTMRKLREKLKQNPVALEQKRKKDREYYYKKKDQGLIKTIKDLNARDQRNLRKKWREDARKRREVMKIQRRTEKIIQEGTPPSSPIPSGSLTPTASSLHPQPSSSRVISGKSIAARNKRILKSENIYLRQRLQVLESKLAKYRMRDHRANKSDKKNKNETNESSQQDKENKNILSKKGFIRVERIKKTIHNFLSDDQYSRLTSGKKETITRKKQKKQIRLLNDTLTNLHVKFQKETGSHISYKTFCRYRPFWIISPKSSARDTCLCSMHENVNFVVQALKTARIIKENSALEVAKSLCCNRDGNLKEICLERKCSKCVDKVIEFSQYIGDDSIFYQHWVTKKIPTIVKGQEKICQKTIKEKVMTNKRSLIDILQAKMPHFMQHIGNILHQSSIVRKIKKDMIHQQCGFLHCDFSENYLCKYGREVQSAHFGGSKQQLSLHTSVFYYKNNDDCTTPNHKSYCTISENLRHDPVLVCAHLKPVIDNIKANLVPDIKTFHILSDGPSSQYRNKSMFFLLVEYLSVELDAEEIYWHFSESGHGKGAPDGVGGCLKRAADRQVGLGRDISDIQSLVSCLQENVQATTVIPIDDTHLSEIEDKIKNAEIQPFKGTLKIHQITWHRSNPKILHARKLSCITCSANAVCTHYEIGQIQIKSEHYEDLTRDVENLLDAPSYGQHKKKWRIEDIYSDSSEDNIPLATLAQVFDFDDDDLKIF